MKHQKRLNSIWLIVFSAVFVLIAAAGYTLSEPIKEAPFSLLIEQGAHPHTLSLWFDDEETWYAFLPAYAQPEHVRFKSAGKGLYLDGTAVEDGASLVGVELRRPYTVANRRGQHTQVVFLRSDNLPTVYLDTESGSMKYLENDKNRKENGRFLLVDIDETEISFDALPWISGRGNGSWAAAKKGWGFKLPEPTSLLGMSTADKWVLLANAYDVSDGLRNFSAYRMASDVGLEYSCDLRFVDLYLNGLYAGMYQLVEKIDEGADRLDIGDLDARNAAANPSVKLDGDTMPHSQLEDGNGKVIRTWSGISSPEDISGGYIVEHNYGSKFNDKPYRFITEAGERFVIRYPEVVSREEADYIYALFRRVEAALFSDGVAEESPGCSLTNLVDLDSWVKKYLVDEITKNEGAGITSSYFYKKQGEDRLYAGPVWDYDKSLGTSFGGLWHDPEGLSYCELHRGGKSSWWRQFYARPEAYPLITRYYAEIFRPYIVNLTETLLDEWAKEISADYYMDQVRWRKYYPGLETDQDPGDAIPEALRDSVSYIKDWLNTRMDFLDRVWLNGEVYYNVSVGETEVYAVPAGGSLSNVTDTTDLIYTDAKTGGIFDPDQPVTEDKELLVSADIDRTSDEASKKVSVVTGRIKHLAAQLSGHKTSVMIISFCAMLGLIGIVLLCIDAGRFGRGGRHGSR